MSFTENLITTLSTSSTTDTPSDSSVSDHFCRIALYYEIPTTKIRIWDVVILVPNLVFLIFLIVRFNRARLKLRATNSPIYFAFYCLVVVNVVISILRCIISMFVNSASVAGEYTDVILWVFVRFFLLSTEISVIIFGLAFGHLDSATSIRRVLIVTSLVSFAYSVCQGLLEILAHDEVFHVSSRGVLLFGHGGVLFWFVSSIIFTVLYVLILLLPWTRLKDKLALPAKRSFYVYVALLLTLNLSCSLGGALLLINIREGLCIVDITTGVYFTFFTPLVYYTFLNDVFEASQPNINFSYKYQTDEIVEDDNVSLPHQQSFSSVKTDSDYIYQSNNLYESTQFSGAPPINPLYVASLQSPDSITGYSLDSQIIDLPSGSKV